MLKRNVIMSLVITVALGSVAMFPVLSKSSTTLKQSNTSYKKENEIKKESNSDKSEKKNQSSNSISESKNSKTNLEQQQTVLKIETPKKETSANTKVETSNKNQVVQKQENEVSASKPVIPTIYYDRTTSIYENDYKTLIRVEYYVNNKLTYYSRVEQFDVATTSYVEKIYKYNYETNTEELVRTDIYENAKLINSY